MLNPDRVAAANWIANLQRIENRLLKVVRPYTISYTIPIRYGKLVSCSRLNIG